MKTLPLESIYISILCLCTSQFVLNIQYRDDFRDFSQLCFKEFGERVKHWITLNKPLMYSVAACDLGIWPPSRCSKSVNEACQARNSSTEPYVVAHNLILSHATAVKLYRQKYHVSHIQPLVISYLLLVIVLTTNIFFTKIIGHSKWKDWNNINNFLVHTLFQFETKC